MLEVVDFKTDLFNNISLKINESNIIGIFGKNGSGKTTFAKYIAGYFDDYQGDIIINKTIRNSINYDVGLLLQNPYHQFVGVSIFDDLTYFLEQNKFTNNQIKSILDSYPIDLNKVLSTLSGGEAQEVLINNFLLTNKNILILDETFSNLDTLKKEYLFSKLKSCKKTIIFITNNLHDLKYCDDIYEIKNKELRLNNSFKNKEEFSYNKNELEDIIKINNLKVDNLNKEINVSFKKGLNILTGPSGSGKSTIFEALCNFVKYKGEIINPFKNIQIVNQYPFEQILSLKVKEIFGQSSPEDYLKKFDLDKSILNMDVVDLSTGELTQILIVKALLSNAKLILLDESLEVLDEYKQKLVLNIFESLKEITFICITHNKSIYDGQTLNVVELI